MISQEKLNQKLQTKAEAINTSVVALDTLIQNYLPQGFDPNAKVKLADHAALQEVIAGAINLIVLVNEFGLLKNINKTPKAKAANGQAGRSRRQRQF
jgi:hypothetical protein